MADADTTEAKNYATSVPMQNVPFFLKGSNNLDWGMKNRLAQIFNPTSGRTVMLAFDHGYFLGPTSGLERIDLNIVPLIEYADTLMLTRGILRTTIPPTYTRGIVLRASGGPSILKELSDEEIAVSIDEAVRLNVAAMAVQVFIGGEHETRSAVGKEMVRDAQYMRLATRMCAELGATYVKTYYVDEDFDTVTASCPVPIVIAGGKKLPEPEALQLAYNAVQQGAAGVDMGRNIFQSKAPAAMIQAVRAVVHENLSPTQAYDLYLALKESDKQSVEN